MNYSVLPYHDTWSCLVGCVLRVQYILVGRLRVGKRANPHVIASRPKVSIMSPRGFEQSLIGFVSHKTRECFLELDRSI